jgi:hypothetical protein
MHRLNSFGFEYGPQTFYIPIFDILLNSFFKRLTCEIFDIGLLITSTQIDAPIFLLGGCFVEYIRLNKLRGLYLLASCSIPANLCEPLNLLERPVPRLLMRPFFVFLAWRPLILRRLLLFVNSPAFRLG